MSKKKVSGSTMTLKDFHGGSIPSDLPLPSAPGVVPRPVDRPSYDRASWANSMGRPDQRHRPNSSPSLRHFDDRTPFLTQSSSIGRNFDEDERTPLDGSSAQRRTFSDDSFRRPETRLDLRPLSSLGGRESFRQGTSLAGGVGIFGSGKASDTAHIGVNPQNGAFTNGLSGIGTYSNAWAFKKEGTVGPFEPLQSSWSAQTSFSKLADPSALEKVSTGRWQSKPHYQVDILVPHQSNMDYDEKNSFLRMPCPRDYSDATLARRVERSLIVEEGFHARKNIPAAEIPALGNFEASEKRIDKIGNDSLPTSADDKISGIEKQPSVVPYEAAERPKLKLLPRTRPMEHVDHPAKDLKQELKPDISRHEHIDVGSEVGRNTNPMKPSVFGNESFEQPFERPKLNLKPRSQTLEPTQNDLKTDRNAVFGGARPRELVLRERGVDDVAISANELVQHRDRVNQSIMKNERVSEQQMLSRHGERVETIPHDQKIGKKADNKDSRGDVDRTEIQRSWRNEIRRNGKESERRPPSPETWRKPIQLQKPASFPEGTGLRFGKAASAMELAQAFAKPCSEPKADGRPANRGALAGRPQMPFSRLTGPTPRHINGY